MIKVCSSKEPRIPENAMIIAINDQSIDDVLEYRFYNDRTKTRRLCFEYNGEKTELIIKPDTDISIQLDTPAYRQCENKCDFCFIKGLPQGMRRELYFRDDDYRLSFMYGNFLSLTNMSSDDIKRIGRLHLSPMYISVHSTDPKTRQRLFKNKKAALIMDQLRTLVNNDIKLHCQIVVIPGVNDGLHLSRSIDDLAALYPGVASIGIVPVGKTKYIKNIQLLSQKQTKQIIEEINTRHLAFRKKYGRGLVYLADEFFMHTHTPIPRLEYYDDFPQYENGIGIVRSTLQEIEDLRIRKKIHRHYALMTGVLAQPVISILKEKMKDLGCIDDNITIIPVTNSYFGPSVTVAGLLSAQDINRVLQQIGEKYDRVILPPDCTNEADQFIDNLIINDDRVMIAPNKIKDLVKCLQ